MGFDINCGVRLCALNLELNDLKDMKKLGRRLKGRIPAGLLERRVELTSTQMESILSEGAKAAVELGLGHEGDLSSMESNGLLEGQQRTLSERALKRGELALGTLGSGNHFLELQVVDQILDPEAAKAFGLRKGQVTAMIHTGSRGLGHQVCSDHVDALERHTRKVQPVGMQKSGTSHCPIGSWPRPLPFQGGQAYFKRCRRLEITHLQIVVH